MSDIIIMPQIKKSEQYDHFIELDCQNPEESIVPIPPIKECRKHDVTVNVEDLKKLVEAAKQDIGGQLTSLATKKEVQDLSDRIPDDVASKQFVYSREHAIESLIEQEILSIKNSIDSIDLTHLAKEATLLAKVAELKEALNTIDFTSIEQAIQDVEDVTARQETLTQGVENIIKAVKNIDFTDLEKSIADVKNEVTNIDFSALAQEDTLTQGLSSVESKVEAEADSIEAKINEIVTAYNNGQEIIDQMVAIQLQTIIGDGD